MTIILMYVFNVPANIDSCFPTLYINMVVLRQTFNLSNSHTLILLEKCIYFIILKLALLYFFLNLKGS